jgi:hypothetical protein
MIGAASSRVENRCAADRKGALQTSQGKKNMTSTDLITFLDCPDGPQQFKRAVAEPLAIFRRALTTKGYSSAPVEITTQKITISIKAKHVRRLCEWYLAGDIDGVEIDYIASALTLCPDFVPESESINSCLYGLGELHGLGKLRPADEERARVAEVFKEVGGEGKGRE